MATRKSHLGRSRLARKLLTYSTLSALAAVDVDNPAHGSIVYTDLGEQGAPIVNGFDVDLDNNGTVDFDIFEHYSSSSFNAYFVGRYGNLVVTQPGRFLTAESISLSQPTGLLKLVHSARAGVSEGVRGYGEFVSQECHEISSMPGQSWCTLNGLSGYAGMVFLINSEPHLGWLHLDWEARRVFGFAYESVPRTPIRAGDTGSLSNPPGDTNADGVVDFEDLNNVRNHFGASGEGILGDTNNDDLVDLEDLNAVRNNFGAGGTNPVPEPPSLVLLAAGAAGLAAMRRRRMKSN